MMPPSTHDIIPAREATSNDHPTTSRESENDDIPPLAERLTASEARKRARADAGGDGGSTGKRVRSPERAAARSQKRRAILNARSATTAAARRHAIAATQAAVTSRESENDDTPPLRAHRPTTVQTFMPAPNPELHNTDPSPIGTTNTDHAHATHHSPHPDTHERPYPSSPGLYEAELSVMRDEASLDMYVQYYQSIHVPSLRHSERPDLRHIEDEVAHYVMWMEREEEIAHRTLVMWLESQPSSPLLFLLSPTGPLRPWSCVLGFLLGDNLSGWITATHRSSLTHRRTAPPPFTPRAHLPHTGSTVTVPPGSWSPRSQGWENDWAPPRLRMCARVLACLRLSHITLAPNGLLATMRRFYDEFTFQYFPQGHQWSHRPPPALPCVSRFAARLAILHPDNTVATSIHIAFDSYQWAVAQNIMTRSWNVARRSHIIHNTSHFASHDPMGYPWEPDGYLEECGRPARHDAHSFPPRDDWRQLAPLGIAASTFSIPLPPSTLNAIRTLFRTGAQRVVLEFYNHETSPSLILAGDTMARRSISTPDPHLPSRHPFMPEVVAATSLSRRGYSSHTQASCSIGGDMYISFHAGLGPPCFFEDDRIDARENDAFWGLARRALPQYVSDGNALIRPISVCGVSTRPGHPSLRHVEVVIQARPTRVTHEPNRTRDPNTWRRLWFIIGEIIPQFLVGRSYTNWISYKNSVQYTEHLTSPIHELFDPTGYKIPQQFQSQSWLHLRLRQASRELARIITGFSLHSDGGRRPTPLTTMLETCRDHLHHWDFPPPLLPTSVSASLAARCPRMSVRVSLVDDSDVISESVLITCPPSGITQYVHDAWLPLGPLHFLLEPREAAAVAGATPFCDVPPSPTDSFPSFWEECGYNNDGLPFADRAERLPGVVPRRGDDLGVPAPTFAIPVPGPALSQISDWITARSPRGTRALIQVHYPTNHNRLYTLLSGDRIDPPVLDTGLPRTDRHPQSDHVQPVTHQLRIASSFRARAAYPSPVRGPPPYPSRKLHEHTTALASGDLFVTVPTFDDIVPTSLWECLHIAARNTAHLNPGLDMPHPPTCSQWRFRPAEILIQAHQLATRMTPPLPSTHTEDAVTSTDDNHPIDRDDA